MQTFNHDDSRDEPIGSAVFGELDDEYEVDEYGQFRLVLSDYWRERD